LNFNTQNDWVARSLQHVWHPCTQMQHHETVPLIPVSHGRGAWLYDMDGKRYLDAISSWWVNLFGHANPRINAALKDQLDQLEHAMLAGFTHTPVIELSEKLAALTSHQLGHCFYASDGASAVEIALKMSFHSWRNRGRPTSRNSSASKAAITAKPSVRWRSLMSACSAKRMALCCNGHMWLLRRMRVWRRKAKALPMSLCVPPPIWNVCCSSAKARLPQ
jgi:hypothetical protein